MKKILFIITLPIFVFANFFTFKPVDITDDISCFVGDFNPVLKSNQGFVSNICYIDIGKSLVLLDSGATYNFAKELNAFIEKKTGKKISHLVVTNYHDDRLLGASFFKENGVEIIGGEGMSDMIKEHSAKYERVLKLLPADLIANTKVVHPNIEVSDEYTIKGSKKSIKIIKPSTGTQSSTDLIVYSPKDDFVFTGNTIFNGRFVNYASDSDMDGWIKALKTIEKIGAKHVVGGHGTDFSKDSFRPTLEYLEMLKKQVKTAYEKDIDPADLSKNIHTNRYKNIPHYEELYMRNARNYYNQLEWE